jgi:hypothetical protein
MNKGLLLLGIHSISKSFPNLSSTSATLSGESGSIFSFNVGLEATGVAFLIGIGDSSAGFFSIHQSTYISLYTLLISPNIKSFSGFNASESASIQSFHKNFSISLKLGSRQGVKFSPPYSLSPTVPFAKSSSTIPFS